MLRIALQARLRKALQAGDQGCNVRELMTEGLGGAAASLPADAEAGVPPAGAQRHNQGIPNPPVGQGIKV